MALKIEKLLAPLFPVGGGVGAVVTNVWFIIVASNAYCLINTVATNWAMLRWAVIKKRKAYCLI